MSLAIKKGDKVTILSGKDKGKSGKVLEILKDDSRVLIEGLNLAKKHLRKRSESEPGGIKEIPMPMHLSKIALVCASCSKPVRFGIKILKDKSKIRVCKKCQQAI
ncbi:MAG: 50S ribosomal protein L24 [Candidatus Omnitrophota bacterium]|jgi:large subunit ribosomal protein L24